MDERGKLEEERKSYPVNYNHYYTDTIQKRRQSRQKESLAKKFSGLMPKDDKPTNTTVNIETLIKQNWDSATPDMEEYSGEEALDCLYSIYKVIQLMQYSGPLHSANMK